MKKITHKNRNIRVSAKSKNVYHILYWNNKEYKTRKHITVKNGQVVRVSYMFDGKEFLFDNHRIFDQRLIENEIMELLLNNAL